MSILLLEHGASSFRNRKDFKRGTKEGGIPPLGDGKASERIADILEKRFSLK
jgi:hypothetical protein